MGIGFTWEHAKEAEPRELAKKVLRLIQDKNLFIGICTKKEGAIDPTRLKRNRWVKDTLKVKEIDVSWKTSDWIIQEIGLSIGRGMDLMFLLEEGLRPPGGLQGNLEYITFTRESPEKSFNKILEMIRSLIPKAGMVKAESAEVYTIAKEKQPLTEEKGEEWLQPKEDWRRRNYEFALLHMIGTGDKAGEQKIIEAYLSSPEGQKEENKDAWKAVHECLKLFMDKGGSLRKLESLAQAHSNNSEVLHYLAKGYQKYEQYEKAAMSFQSAAEQEQDKMLKVDRLGDVAIAFAHAGDAGNKYQTIEKMKTIAQGVNDTEIIIIGVLQKIAKIEKDKDAYLACTERLLDLRPDDNDMRFNLAYEYSEVGREDLALFHYNKIPNQRRSSATWNNIGVANARLNLDGKAIESYRKSEELGETLAISNLAKKLISAGFLPEAEEICERAIKIENYDKDVGSTISRLKEVQEEEKSRQEQILTDTRRYREFYKDFGRACGKPLPSIHRGTWEGPKCRLNLEIKEGKLTAEGTYEVSSLGLLAAALAGWPPALQTPKIVRYMVRYQGSLAGLAVKSQVTIEEDENVAKSTSLLTAASKSKEALMVISDDLSEIRVYEKDAPEGQRFYLLKHIET